MSSSSDVASLRPAVMLSRPVRLQRTFHDPEAMMDLIEQRAPYLGLAESHGMQDTLGGARARLSVERVIDIYRQDLADRGISISKPANPFRDEWRKTLERTYLSPFSAQAAGDCQRPNSRPSIDSPPRPRTG